MSFFRNPDIRKTILLDLIIIIVLTIGGKVLFAFDNSLFIPIIGAVLIAVHLVSDYLRYKRLSELSFDIDQLLHGKDTIDFTIYDEGELAILSSEIQKMVIRLREQSEALQQDKVYLADSIANIAHQLRTPLTSMNLITSLLSNSELSLTERRKLIGELSGLLGRIDWLINALLKISRLDAKTVTFKKDRVLLKDLIKKSSDPIAIAMDLKGQNLLLELQEGSGYIGDIQWSSEALGNIIKNAVENTEVGGEVRIKGVENPVYTELIVEDNGKGIDIEDLPHLFERFYRGKNASSNSIGIGLALARMIIMEQNGTIKVENRREGGARFIIRFYKGAI